MEKTLYEVWTTYDNFTKEDKKCFDSQKEAMDYAKQVRKNMNGKGGYSISIDLCEYKGDTFSNFIKTLYHKKYNY